MQEKKETTMQSSSFALYGRLTAKPELRHTPTGKAVTNFTVAENRTYKSGDETKQKTLYHKFEYWEKQAEHYVKYLDKGTPITALGCTPIHKEHKLENGYKVNETLFTGGSIIFHPVSVNSFTANEEDVPVFLNTENQFHADSIPF
jgi:hypothetical protein